MMKTISKVMENEKHACFGKVRVNNSENKEAKKVEVL